MKNLVAYKSNSLIEASYKLSLQEQRLLLVCIGKINPLNTTQNKTFQITSHEFFNAFPDMGKENAERRLQEASDKLAERWIYIQWQHKEEKIRWVQGQVKYFTGEAKIELVFSDLIMPYLTQLKNKFTGISIKNISSLKRTYSIRLYELLIQYKEVGYRKITVEAFRSMLNVENKYEHFKDLNKFILLPALHELNTKSNITVNLHKEKKGRNISALLFSFREK
ncbi:Protein involved in initiation of plasmid replication (PDB:2Z9O) [Commensalibacter communis]|uniref:Protein involved in initiation of plasmid replication n=1 Tax=Commensalibacter communis TaxID=2972786 RepID=A0A9W4XE92_9PROT|nr:replication initiation protein [Commensalibacter communis]CAI3959995.1 Protein involved in initiation of plasmid replication (PDB:2Z9O) [Commensalibacter communis]CAI3961052.1 Protein involved in initiation of plasmid replication (PDB:2Z9O) [Commensalibacter communis]CAI3961175.1 Protein involved in initiation of plasmid replication (PDB:2Z9O) [Commensalibacter communis]CAI3961659.1 Protein involved in initiation of plasmid replication (PDB:2Z9O) [Commensalibacter communis]